MVAELEGALEDVEVLVAWFGHGPPGANVDRIEIDERTPTGEGGFAVGPSG